MSTTKKRSVESSPSSSNMAQKKTPKHSRLGREIIAGLKEGAAFLRGETALRVRLVNVPGAVDVKAIRAKTGMSQAEFASAFALNRRTLQDWEQGRMMPDPTVRAYLTVIGRNPQAVMDALR